MSAASLERFLARLYTDDRVRARFLANPVSEAAAAGLTEQECAALERIDRAGLELAARSYERKRSRQRSRRRRWWR